MNDDDEMRPPRMPSMMMPFLAMAMMATLGAGIQERPKADELDGVDIEAEYKLIQQKRSKLSRRLRDRVVQRYKNNQGEL